MSTYRVQSSSLQCRNNCGFYGNPSWDGYCSVCYRAIQVPQDSSRSASNVFTVASVQALSRFDAKRKQLAGRGATILKNIFRISKDGIRERNSALPEECFVAASEFNSFLASLKAAPAADVSQMVSKLLDELETMGGSHINQYSLVIQNFYQHSSDRIAKSSLYSSLSSTVKDKLICAIERFVTTWIYCWAFASPITDDETIDQYFQEKLRSLYWITPTLLDSPIDPSVNGEMECIEAATLALIKVNAVYASEDKLEQIAKCCTKVFSAIHRHQQSAHESLVPSSSSSPNPSKPSTSTTEPLREPTGNADDFLPSLIWVVIRANPPMLHSNLQYIMRFANQKRLNSGQAGYFFTNLSCAVHFLTKLNHESLNMTERQFYQCMRTGLALDNRKGRQCEGELLLNDNELRLVDMQQRMREFDEEKLKPFKQNFQEFDDHTKKKIETIRDTLSSIDWTPLRLDPRHLEDPLSLTVDRSAVDSSKAEGRSLLELDDEDSAATKGHLPEPIQPVKCHPKPPS